MDKIVELRGTDIERFYNSLGIDTVPNDVYLVRVWTGGNTVKVKVNEYTWSPPIGN